MGIEFEMSSDYVVESYFDTTVDCTISKIGEQWYQDVFEFISDNEEDYYIRMEDNEINYGA